MSRVRFKRFKVTAPSADVVAKYERAYLSKALYWQPDDLAPITSAELFGADFAEHKMVLDFGCGRGEFILGQAQERPDELFVGLDYHQKSIWWAIHRAVRDNIENVRFVRADFRRVLVKVPDAAVAEVFMLFPPTASIRRKRNTDPLTEAELQAIHRVMVPGALFHFVSDHDGYFDWKRRMIERSQLFEVTASSRGFEGGQTRYQRHWEQLSVETKRLVCRKLDVGLDSISG